jgi:hypothetical protein
MQGQHEAQKKAAEIKAMEKAKKYTRNVFIIPD